MGFPAVPRNRILSGFRSLKRKMLRIPFHGTKIEANFRKFVSKHFVEENSVSILLAGTGNFFAFNHFLKTRQLKVLKIVSEKTTFEVRTNHFVKKFCLFCETNFFCRIPFYSKLRTLPWTSECLGLSTFFRGITATVPSLFRGISSERNSVPNLKHGSVSGRYAGLMKAGPGFKSRASASDMCECHCMKVYVAVKEKKVQKRGHSAVTPSI
jgi:hypothetical protein